MEFPLAEKDRRFTSHSPTWDDAEPERKRQRLGGDSDESGGDSNSVGNDGSISGGSSGDSTEFIGNEQDDEYFEQHKHLLEPEDYEKWTQEEKRQYGRYIHQLVVSNCYYLDFFPTVYRSYGPRAVDFKDEYDPHDALPSIKRCIQVVLRKQKEELELVCIVRANFDVGYGYVFWITMDVTDKVSGEIKTCICKVHSGVKGEADDDVIVEDFKFIPSCFKYMQGTTLDEQASSLFGPIEYIDPL